jgi:hypothetical protein
MVVVVPNLRSIVGREKVSLANNDETQSGWNEMQ